MFSNGYLQIFKNAWLWTGRFTLRLHRLNQLLKITSADWLKFMDIKLLLSRLITKNIFASHRLTFFLKKIEWKLGPKFFQNLFMLIDRSLKYGEIYEIFRPE